MANVLSDKHIPMQPVSVVVDSTSPVFQHYEVRMVTTLDRSHVEVKIGPHHWKTL